MKSSALPDFALDAADLEKLVANMNSNQRQVGGDHYAAEYQHWDFAAEANLPWCEACSLKYLCRIFKKNGLEDALKIEHYLQKLMEQFYSGLVCPPMLEHEHRRKQFLYSKFMNAQDLRAPTPFLEDAVNRVAKSLAEWETLSDLHRSVRYVRSLIKEFTKHLGENTPKAEEVDPAEPTSAYVNQDYQEQRTTPLIGVPKSPDEAINKYFQITGDDPRSSVFPLRVYSSLIEKARRDRDVSLNISVSNDHAPFFRDYAEASLKLDLAVSTLDESIPNKQYLRTALAFAALRDATMSLSMWGVPRLNDQNGQILGMLIKEAKDQGNTRSSMNEYLGAEVYKG